MQSSRSEICPDGASHFGATGMQQEHSASCPCCSAGEAQSPGHACEHPAEGTQRCVSSCARLKLGVPGTRAALLQRQWGSAELCKEKKKAECPAVSGALVKSEHGP